MPIPAPAATSAMTGSMAANSRLASSRAPMLAGGSGYEWMSE